MGSEIEQFGEGRTHSPFPPLFFDVPGQHSAECYPGARRWMSSSSSC